MGYSTMAVQGAVNTKVASSSLAIPVCTCGGIGIRAGFRFQWSNP